MSRIDGTPKRCLPDSRSASVARAKEAVGRTYSAANHLVADFERLGLLREATGGSRNRVFECVPYVEIVGERRP